MIVLAALLALIFLTLGAILSLTIFQSRRTHRIMTQTDDLTTAAAETGSALQSLLDQQAATEKSVLAAIARVEALIVALQNQNNPALDAVINSLHQMKADLGGALVVEKMEQDTLDAERPDPPPPAGPTPIA